MSNDLNQSLYVGDEIDLKEIFKTLLESKKLILLTILIFTIGSIIYSLSLKPEFKSSSIVEIGSYEMADGTVKLIEEPLETISSIKTNLIHKKRDDFLLGNLIIKSLENKLIELQLTSKSSKKNEDLLSEIINYIDARHTKHAKSITEQKKDELEMVESELSFVRAKVLEENQSKKLSINSNLEMVESELSFVRALELSKIENRLAKLTIELPIIDLEIKQLEKIILDDTYNLSLLKENDRVLLERAADSPTLDQIIFNYRTQINALNRNKSSYILEIESLNNQLQIFKNDTFQSDQLFRLEQEKATLENELQILMNQTQLNTRLIGNIETDTLKPKTLLIISFGIIIGFITSIFLVFISNFLKSFRAVKA